MRWNVLDLFSGIGGFSLGLERAGMKTVAFCEIEPFCQKVLRKHWPNVPIHEDVTKLTANDIAEPVDVICGGFPCQDISFAGKGAGLAGERSGLWKEFARLIGEIRPRYVIVENVAALLDRGLGDVLGDLAALRYDAEWHCIPASHVGADHIRDRFWLIADDDGRRIRCNGERRLWSEIEMGSNASNSVRGGLPRRVNGETNDEDARRVNARPRFAFDASIAFPRQYRNHQPVMGRGVHGISNRVDRIRALGNAVVPQIPEMIGRAIIEAHS